MCLIIGIPVQLLIRILFLVSSGHGTHSILALELCLPNLRHRLALLKGKRIVSKRRGWFDVKHDSRTQHTFRGEVLRYASVLLATYCWCLFVEGRNDRSTV